MTILVPYGNGPISYTVLSLTPGTQYTFILFSVLDHITSSGVNITAVTGKITLYQFTFSDPDSFIFLTWGNLQHNKSKSTQKTFVIGIKNI